MIYSNVKTSSRGQKEVDDFLKRISKAQDAYVSVGFHEDAGAYEDGTSVVEVALWNEFGTRTSPERSFLRSAIDESSSLINQWRIEMINNILSKGWTVEKALEAIGFRIQVLIQSKIKSNVPPPNEPGTLAAKKREGVGSQTLIETGLMLRSVTFKVHLGGE